MIIYADEKGQPHQTVLTGLKKSILGWNEEELLMVLKTILKPNHTEI